MGDVTFSNVSGALEQRFRQRLSRQPNRAAVTANLLKKRRGKGKNAAWIVTVGTDVGQYFDDGADVAVFNTDSKLPATLQWSELGDAFAITGRAEDAAAGDETEMAQEFMNELAGAGERAAAKVNLELWTGLGTAAPQKILGLATSTGPLDSTGSYAGIDRGTYPQWAGNVYSNGGVARAFSWALVDQAFSDVYVASGRAPKAMVTTPSIWKRAAQSMDPQMRYLKEVYIRGQKVILDAGWEAVNYNGIPLFKDKDVPSGHFGGLDLDEIEIEYLPVAPARIARGDVKGFIPIAGTPEEQGSTPPQGTEALMAAVYVLARNGNKTKIQVACTAQLTAQRCNSSFLIKDLGA